MLALIKSEAGVRLERTGVPQRMQGEVLLRVAFAGVCRTDLYVAQGILAAACPVVLGHEFSGVVVEADAESGLHVGARVAVNPKLSCGTCNTCRGWDQPSPPPCAEARMLGVRVNGCFAEYVLVPATAVLPIPDSLSLQLAAYVEPVAAALACLRAPLRKGARGLVVGQNRIAELTLRVLQARGFLSLTKQDVPAASSVARDQEADFDFVIETVATEASVDHCLKAVRPGGAVLLRSRPVGAVPVQLGLCVAKDVTLYGLSYGSFPEAVALLASGALQVADLLAPPAPLSDFVRIFELAEHPLAPKHLFALAPEQTGSP
jgi:L-iditol 2-dehydrogenase